MIPEGKHWPPRWLVDRLGIDYFARVIEVSFVATAPDPSIADRKGATRSGPLNAPPITDAVLAHLKELTDISVLSLRSAAITDAGLCTSERAHQTLGSRPVRYAHLRHRPRAFEETHQSLVAQSHEHASQRRESAASTRSVKPLVTEPQRDVCHRCRTVEPEAADQALGPKASRHAGHPSWSERHPASSAETEGHALI